MIVQSQRVIPGTEGGDRAPAVLAKLPVPRIKASKETLRQSLEGNWCPARIVVMKQKLSLYRGHREPNAECDREIEELLADLAPQADPEQEPIPEDRKRRQRKTQDEHGQPRLRHAPRSLQALWR